MQVAIKKWGNRLALCIPEAFWPETHLEDNSIVDMSLINGKIIIAIEPQPMLDDLLAGVAEENLHGEINTGLGVRF